MMQTVDEPTSPPPPLAYPQPLGAATLPPVDTCGYLSGDPDSAIVCPYGHACAVDTSYGLVDCCESVSLDNCVLPTRCLDKLLSGLPNRPSSRDTTCSDDRWPYCVTNVFAGVDGLNEFAMFSCDSVTRRTAGTIWITPTPIEETTRSPSNAPPSHSKPSPSPNNTSTQAILVGSITGAIGKVSAGCGRGNIRGLPQEATAAGDEYAREAGHHRPRLRRAPRRPGAAEVPGGEGRQPRRAAGELDGESRKTRIEGGQSGGGCAVLAEPMLLVSGIS